MREPTFQEERLLEHLIKISSSPIPANWNEGLLVSPMHDGGMGSLLLVPQRERRTERRFGKQVSEWQFHDQDGVTVIASLYVDTDGCLFELDMWKTDYSRLIRFPDMEKDT